MGDVVFVVDSSSGSLDEGTHWELLKDFLMEMVNKLNIGESHTRVGMVTYASSDSRVFYLKDHYGKEDIIAEIEDMDLRGGDRNIYEGLRALTSSQFKSTKGDRDDAENVAVVIATGAANEDESRTLGEAQDAKDEGIYVFSVGLSDDVSRDEIESISSPPHGEDAQYFVSDFSDLDDLAYRITHKICTDRDPVTTTAEPTTTTEAPCKILMY